MHWRCTVCGYRSEGPEPPENCPVCGADRSKFVPLEEEDGAERGTASGASEASPASSAETKETSPAENGTAEKKPADKESAEKKGSVEGLLFVRELMVKGRAHPVLVHIPNGVLPVAALLLFLGLVFSHEGLVLAAYYNLVVVVVSIPLVFFAGWVDWQAHLGAVYTNVIVTKIASAVIAFVLGLVLVLWKSFSDDPGWPFFLLLLVMLASASV